MLIETWLEQAPARVPTFINGKRTYMKPRRFVEAMTALGYPNPQIFAPVLGLEYRNVLDMLRGKRAIPLHVALAVRALENKLEV